MNNKIEIVEYKLNSENEKSGKEIGIVCLSGGGCFGLVCDGTVCYGGACGTVCYGYGCGGSGGRCPQPEGTNCSVNTGCGCMPTD